LENFTADGDKVTALFEDGSKETGNLIIGADGSRSKVREILVGVEAAKPEMLDYTMVNHSAGSYTAEQVHLLRAIHPIVKIAHHPENQGGFVLAGKFFNFLSARNRCMLNNPIVLDNPDPSKPEMTKFQVFQSWKGPPRVNELGDPRERMKVVKERARQFCEPFRTAMLTIDDEVILPLDQGAQWKPVWWDNWGGKVTLAGDAAHSMLPRESCPNYRHCVV
jgi:2-polyprenyl-6-methoxyphenol hydroxylase-like FAD-dependent oxidoreductase